jgi:homoserine kinase
MEKQVTAFAPASVSNVACGFDIMGFALERPGDTVTVRFSKSPGVNIRTVTGNGASIPLDPSRNTAGAPVISMLKRCRISVGVEIDIHKGLPPGSGIGSSAASAVAAAVASNALLDAGLSQNELLECAIEGEKIASQALHVDNLAPCLWGGFILVRGYSPIDIVQIPVPESLWCTIILPDLEIQTSESRKLLPKVIPLSDSVTQTGNASGLIAGLLMGDFALIGRSLHDVIAEPVRRNSIPGFTEMKEAALGAGALGCSISGSGPALFALSSSEKSAASAGKAMGQVLERLDCKYSVILSRISRRGARIISQKNP